MLTVVTKENDTMILKSERAPFSGVMQYLDGLVH